MSETNLQERLEQCRKDKAAIEAQEQALLEEIEAERLKNHVPFARSAKAFCGEPRLVLHCTPEFCASVQECEGLVASFGRNGKKMSSANETPPTRNLVVWQYDDIKTLID